MIIEHLPEITPVAGGAKTLNTQKFPLDNYRVAALLFENPEDNQMTVTVKGTKENGDTAAVPFLFKKTDETDYKEIAAAGKAVTDAGAYLALITADMLSRGEYGAVEFSVVSVSDKLTTVYVLQSQPRYRNNE